MIPIDAVATHAQNRPDSVAVVSGDDTMTWHEFEQRVRVLIPWLENRLHDAESPRIATLARNGWELVVAASAASSLGVPLVGIDPARDHDTVVRQIEAVRPDLLFYDSRVDPSGDLLNRLMRRVGVILDVSPLPDPPLPSIAGVLVAPEPEPSSGTWRKPAFSALGFTSGSTGVPKLFVRTSRTEDQRRRFLREEIGFDAGDVYLVSSPLSHASGHVWANAALALGARIVFSDPTPADILGVVEEQQVTVAFMVPPTLDEVLAEADATDRAMPSVRGLLTGGRHISERTVSRARRLAPGALYLYYATTETGIVAMAGPGDLDRDPLTAGHPMPGVDVAVIDPATWSDVAPGELGLLAVASPVNMDGYAEGEAATVTRDGREYVVTSDFGRVQDGLLFVAGRGADSAPVIDLVAVESAIKQSAAIEDVAIVWRQVAGAPQAVVAVVGDPDPADAEATLRTAGGSGDLDCLALSVPSIPYNTAGKVDQRALFALADAATR